MNTHSIPSVAMLLIVLLINAIMISHGKSLLEFKSDPLIPTKAEIAALREIQDVTLERAIEMGSSSIDGILSLESAILSRGMVIQNGSISHKQLLETLPNKKAQETNVIARKILKASLYIYNTECIQRNIRPEVCAEFLASKEIPGRENSLLSQCRHLLSAGKDGNHIYRRLLRSNYKNGLYSMVQNLPSPRDISNSALHGSVNSSSDGNYKQDTHNKNLALVQWTQFIEHDLSKSVASSLQDGQPIECCANNYVQAPRDVHPECAPLLGVNPFSRLGKETCLNYVRSALSLDKCYFGPAQQLNQATGYLDLSQLYGFTIKAVRSMRTYQDGKLKSSKEHLLPLAEAEVRNLFCALKPDMDEHCFMAGDTRVNSNPYSIILYTVFMRSHNRFADEIKAHRPDWSDDLIFKAARKLNVHLYRKIVFEEWLPVALGKEIATLINSEPLIKTLATDDYEVSSEFAVAAIRFYFSMMPNFLQKPSGMVSNEIPIDQDSSNSTPQALFNLMEHMFRSKSINTSRKLDEFLTSTLNQKALKMDSSYAESLIEEFTQSRLLSRPNVLALDIQRGRDHGLQGYVKYLQHCVNRSISTWQDLDQYIKPTEIVKLKSIYKQVVDIDLIVGGISETPASDSTVGPTFSCILEEQFSKIRQWHHNLHHDSPTYESKFNENMTASKLLCANTNLKEVPRNIFLIPSTTNPLVACAEFLR